MRLVVEDNGAWPLNRLGMVLPQGRATGGGDCVEPIPLGSIPWTAAGFVLLGRPVEELSELAVKSGQPKFRGQQLLDGMLKGARSVDDIPVVRGGRGFSLLA